MDVLFESNEQGYSQRHLELEGGQLLQSTPEGIKAKEFLENFPQSEDSMVQLLDRGECVIDGYSYAAKLRPFDMKTLTGNPETRKKYNVIFHIDEHKSAQFLDNFSLTQSQTGYSINVSQLLPEGFRIILDPEGNSDWASVDVKERIVFIAGDITKLGIVFTLLHEIGHARYQSGLQTEEKERLKEARDRLIDSITTRIEVKYGILNLDVVDQNKLLNNEDFPIILRDERNAWAFALQQMKPFSKQKPLSANLLQSFIHGFNLKSYSDEMRLDMALRQQIASLAK